MDLLELRLWEALAGVSRQSPPNVDPGFIDPSHYEGGENPPKGGLNPPLKALMNQGFINSGLTLWGGRGQTEAYSMALLYGF